MPKQETKKKLEDKMIIDDLIQYVFSRSSYKEQIKNNKSNGGGRREKDK